MYVGCSFRSGTLLQLERAGEGGGGDIKWVFKAHRCGMQIK